MIEFIDVTKDSFNDVYDKMFEDFPYEERRDFEQQKKLLDDNRFTFKNIVQSGLIIGYISYWEYEKFIFVEHFAIDKNRRGEGLGTTVLDEFIKNSQKTIILEVELPTTDYSKKRIAFYKACGFYNNDFYYEQPSYHNGEPLPLTLMSYPVPLNQKIFNLFVVSTKNSAYRI